MKNQFTNVYKNLPTFRLLEIIENGQDYQPLAIEAATLELESRRDIELAKTELNDKKTRDQKTADVQFQKQKEISNKAANIWGVLNPLTQKTPEKSITLLCIVLGALFLYKSITAFHSILFEFGQIANGDLYACWFMVEYLYLPLTIFLLWKRMKLGWQLFLIWLVYGVSTDLFFLYHRFKTSTSDDPLMNLMPQPDFSAYLLVLILHAGLLVFICRPGIRKLFFTEKTQTDSETLDSD